MPRLARHARRVLAATAAGLLTAGFAQAATPSLTITPSVVHRGRTTLVHGNAGGCPAGNTVTLLSRAFPHTHDFAGVPAIFARVLPSGTFRAIVRIPLGRRPGRYGVTARCGGGNFGILRYLTVT